MMKSTLCAVTLSAVVVTQFVPVGVKGSDSISLDSDRAIAGLDISVDNLISAGGTDLYVMEMDNIISNTTSEEAEDANKAKEADKKETAAKAKDKKEEKKKANSDKKEEKKEEKKSEYENVGISIADDYVNVRSESNTDSEIVGKLYRGCAATILENNIKEEDGEWTKIESGNVKGYIKKEYLAIGFDVDELVDKFGTKYATVNTTTLNVRTKTSTDATILTQIPVGESYEVVKEYAKWVKISLDDGDIEGFVAKEYVDISVKFQKAVSIEEEKAEQEREEAARRAQEEQERKLKEQQEAAAEASKKEEKKESSTKTESTQSESKKETTSQETTSEESTSEESTSEESTSQETTASGSTGSDVANYALNFVGNRYVYGGTSLTNGTDCSGFTMSVYAAFGYSLPHHSGSQAAYGTAVTASEGSLQPGDLLFYTNSSGEIGHVAMYIGGGQIVHASNERDGIKISSYNYRTPYCARRIIN